MNINREKKDETNAVRVIQWKYYGGNWIQQLLYGIGNKTDLFIYILPIIVSLIYPIDGRAWKAAVRGVAEGWTRLSDFTFTFHSHALEKEMATHSSVLAWRIPGVGEPDGLPSMGSPRVGHDRSDLAAAAAVEMI